MDVEVGVRFDPPSMSARALRKLVEEAGCEFVRRAPGSHTVYRRPDGLTFTFAFHEGIEVGPRAVKDVLIRDVGLSKDEARRLIERRRR